MGTENHEIEKPKQRKPQSCNVLNASLEMKVAVHQINMTSFSTHQATTRQVPSKITGSRMIYITDERKSCNINEILQFTKNCQKKNYKFRISNAQKTNNRKNKSDVS